MVSYSSDNELLPCFGGKRSAGHGTRAPAAASRRVAARAVRRPGKSPKLPARHSAAQHAADPDNRGELVFGRADRACDKVSRFTNPAAAIDIGAAMPEHPRRERGARL